MNIIYHLFESFTGQKYIFVSGDNEIYHITNQEFSLIQKDKTYIKTLFEKNNIDIHRTIFQRHEVEKLNAPFEVSPSILIIEITNECNFRCSYCIFSGNYKNQRPHGTQQMSHHLLQQIISFVLEKQVEFVSFYGGEPLLAFDKIQYIINSLKQNGYHGKFIFTTNGSLLSEKTIDFLIKEDIFITVSYDGINQSFYRKNKNGKTMEKEILQNLKSILDRDETYYSKNVAFNVTLTPPYNLLKNANFFNTNELFCNNKLQIGFVSNHDVNWMSLISLNEYEKNKLEKEYKMLELEYIHQKTKLPFHKALFDNSMYQLLFRRTENLPSVTMNGCCIPGLRRLFINLEGKIYPCERVNNKLSLGEFTNIENLTENCNKLIDSYYKIAKEMCSDCWMATMCDQCFASVCGNKGISSESFLRSCKEKKKHMSQMLQLFVSCMEEDEKSLDYLKDITMY